MNDYINYKNYLENTIRKYLRTRYTRNPNFEQYTFLSYNVEVDRNLNSLMDRNALYKMSACFRSHYSAVLHLHKFRDTECFYDLVYMYCKFDR